jgi:hypothetical protein
MRLVGLFRQQGLANRERFAELDADPKLAGGRAQ